MESLVERIRQFLEAEARSCSMDFGCVTSEYIFRMWGGTVALEDIDISLKQVKSLL